ncbi:hypothetical protein C8D87_108243 [Lentzea atacamensis]|uniref:Uncharacterized protein n=1 Tax=Lentzea atacamensis TaxID=531938 RepID=A0ABX9E1M8_9PSEU|nr:hypothetical protein [Lentzea atacamensis]RAS62422.1 hypothetical protein C8D87_108243 [Lentzea atacamensis]
MSKSTFSAEPVDGGVLVEMTEEFVTGLMAALDLLVQVYTPGSATFRLRHPWGAVRRSSLLRRMLPQAGASWWLSAGFRRRYREELADPAPVDRVRARCAGPGPRVLTFAEADEWIVVMGQARSLYRLFWKADHEYVMAFSTVQCQLVKALLVQECPAFPEINVTDTSRQ